MKRITGSWCSHCGTFESWMRRQQRAWSVNHMSAPSPLSAGINKSSSEPGAASDELESQETNRGESEELCFLQVGVFI